MATALSPAQQSRYAAWRASMAARLSSSNSFLNPSRHGLPMPPTILFQLVDLKSPCEVVAGMLVRCSSAGWTRCYCEAVAGGRRGARYLKDARGCIIPEGAH